MKRLLLAFLLACLPAAALAQSAPDSYPGGQYLSSPQTLTNLQNSRLQLDANGYLKINQAAAGALPSGTATLGGTFIVPDGQATSGIVPVVTPAAANNLVLKGTPGNLYSVYAANVTATAGFLVVLNATVAPADGAIAPLACAALPASGNAFINFAPGPPSVYSTGITAVVTSAATCFTKTTGVITAFISGSTK